MGTGWNITATMIAGIALWGGVGYVIDRLTSTPHVFFAFGTNMGAAASIYSVYLRYGKGDSGSG